MTVASGKVLDLAQIYRDAKGKCCLSAKEVGERLCWGCCSSTAASSAVGYTVTVCACVCGGCR